MSALLSAADVRAAYERAGALAPADAERWQQVLAWSDAHAGSSGPTASPAQLATEFAAAAPLLEVFTGHHRDPAAGPPPVDPDLLARLTAWFAARDLVLERASVISGGFSRLMLDATWTGGHGVVRIEQGGMFATEGRREVAVMRAVAAQGYPVPEVLWEEPDGSVVGHPFFVMAHVSGAARTDDAGLDDMVRSVAALHRLDASDVAALDGLSNDDPRAVVRAQIDHWRSVYLAAVPARIPVLDEALAWLDDNLRPTGRSVIVHGDPGPGNALQDHSGVTAVIDWEFAHAGDAAEDWAYLALIRGRRLGAPAEWLARLSRAAGVEYDASTWRVWEVFNQVKGACVNLTALEVFRTTPTPNPDLLAIGVAVHLRFLARAVELIHE